MNKKNIHSETERLSVPTFSFGGNVVIRHLPPRSHSKITNAQILAIIKKSKNTNLKD